MEYRSVKEDLIGAITDVKVLTGIESLSKMSEVWPSPMGSLGQWI